ncbi:hypothetical protein TcWFU_004744 [Taenia crassiceps]|uniref:B box-type domain-containing protein n=1 Tax=Taenia crassiceps TaxID=6207 RepID=A0ABR4Q301_9CEST
MTDTIAKYLTRGKQQQHEDEVLREEEEQEEQEEVCSMETACRLCTHRNAHLCDGCDASMADVSGLHSHLQQCKGESALPLGVPFMEGNEEICTTRASRFASDHIDVLAMPQSPLVALPVVVPHAGCRNTWNKSVASIALRWERG